MAKVEDKNMEEEQKEEETEVEVESNAERYMSKINNRKV